MTPKEAFRKISISHEMMAYKYNYYLNHRDEGYQMCINPTSRQLDSIKQALTELEELKRDVKRVYAELMMYLGNNIVIEQEEIDVDYLCNIIEKLSKAGKEDV